MFIKNHLTNISYVLRNTKKMVGIHGVTTYCGVNLSTIQTISFKVIYSNDEEDMLWIAWF